MLIWARSSRLCGSRWKGHCDRGRRERSAADARVDGSCGCFCQHAGSRWLKWRGWTELHRAAKLGTKAGRLTSSCWGSENLFVASPVRLREKSWHDEGLTLTYPELPSFECARSELENEPEGSGRWWHRPGTNRQGSTGSCHGEVSGFPIGRASIDTLTCAACRRPQWLASSVASIIFL